MAVKLFFVCGLSSGTYFDPFSQIPIILLKFGVFGVLLTPQEFWSLIWKIMFFVFTPLSMSKSEWCTIEEEPTENQNFIGEDLDLAAIESLFEDVRDGLNDMVTDLEEVASQGVDLTTQVDLMDLFGRIMALMRPHAPVTWLPPLQSEQLSPRASSPLLPQPQPPSPSVQYMEQ